ncbi:prepilin-type N-terminal cleavage/methylation domain-containing protein [Maricurvus nonylphenolicus]|uniref:type IV pilus modification PilV family protein n=1 Tax=Maricurvus nonylphenolicus TaxID=1008307 RepID=UPI0036F34960
MHTIYCSHKGFTLIEMIVFIVVVAIALLALLGVVDQANSRNVDPIIQARALECAQAKMDQIWGRKFDHNSPPGGIPACGSEEAETTAWENCTGISPESSFNDIGDYDGTTDITLDNCSITVEVTDAGQELGLIPGENNQFRRITVTANSDGGGQAVISAYRGNF